MDETQSKDYSKLWVNIVATLMCGSVLAVIFARILRFFNFNTLIKSGIFTVLIVGISNTYRTCIFSYTKNRHRI